MREINPWGLAMAVMILGMIYITCFKGIYLAFHKKAWRLMWGLLFILGLVCALVLTFPILSAFFNF